MQSYLQIGSVLDPVGNRHADARDLASGGDASHLFGRRGGSLAREHGKRDEGVRGGHEGGDEPSRGLHRAAAGMSSWV